MSVTVRVLSVSDLHCRKNLYKDLSSAVKDHQPDIVAVVGDFLDRTGAGDGLPVAECARQLAGLKCQDVLFVRGNHEAGNWWEFADAWKSSGRALHLLNGSAFVRGPLVVLGFPCLMGCTEDYFEPVASDPSEWISPLLARRGAAIRTLWLMHEPPRGTPLSEKVGPLSGNQEWTDAIERYAPRLVVFGHDHATPLRSGRWKCALGDTTCVNVGQRQNGPLRFCIIDLGFPENSLTLTCGGNTIPAVTP